MTNQQPDEPRANIHKLLDLFTEPGTGEKYLRDLEDDLVSLIAKEQRHLIEQIETAGPSNKPEHTVVDKNGKMIQNQAANIGFNEANAGWRKAIRQVLEKVKGEL